MVAQKHFRVLLLLPQWALVSLLWYFRQSKILWLLTKLLKCCLNGLVFLVDLFMSILMILVLFMIRKNTVKLLTRKWITIQYTKYWIGFHLFTLEFNYFSSASIFYFFVPLYWLSPLLDESFERSDNRSGMCFRSNILWPLFRAGFFDSSDRDGPQSTPL